MVEAFHGFVTTVIGSSKDEISNLDDIYALCIGSSLGMTDTIMIAKYSPRTQTAALLSIPRDTFVGSSQATATPYDKINAKYQESPQRTIDYVNNLTGLNIKYFITVDTKALRDIVDALGGIYFDVPIDMDYDDSSQDLAIHVKAGYQLLNGTQAEGVCRFRHNNNGTSYPISYGDNDIGRMKTQRAFIKAMIEQGAKAKNLMKIDDFIKIAQDEVDTNIEWEVGKKYAAALVKFNTDNLKTAQLPGSTAYLNDYSFYLASSTQTVAMINELFLDIPAPTEEETPEGNETSNEMENEDESANTTSNETKSTEVSVSTSSRTIINENSDVDIEIINCTGSSYKLSNATTQLKYLGYKVVTSKTGNVVPKTMVINRREDGQDKANKVMSLLGVGSVIDAEKLSSECSITIILGRDY